MKVLHAVLRALWRRAAWITCADYRVPRQPVRIYVDDGDPTIYFGEGTRR